MKKHTEEHNKHISEGMKGKNLGRKFSEETKAKMKAAQLKRRIKDMEETSYEEIDGEGFVFALDELYVNKYGDVIRVKEYEDKVYYKLLIPSTTKCGYKQVSLNMRHGAIGVHVLVLLAFVGPCPEGKEVDHRDRNKANNKLNNLRYVTRKENIANTEKPKTHKYFGRYNCKTETFTRDDGKKFHMNIASYYLMLRSRSKTAAKKFYNKHAEEIEAFLA